MKQYINRAGSIGSFITAAACPICFPKLAALGAIFGMGALAPFEAYFFWGAQLFVLLSLVGQFVAFKRLRNKLLLVFMIIFTALFFLSLYVVVSEYLSYLALAGIVLGSLWLMREDRRQKLSAVSCR